MSLTEMCLNVFLLALHPPTPAGLPAQAKKHAESAKNVLLTWKGTTGKLEQKLFGPLPTLTSARNCRIKKHHQIFKRITLNYKTVRGLGGHENAHFYHASPQLRALNLAWNLTVEKIISPVWCQNQPHDNTLSQTVEVLEAVSDAGTAMPRNVNVKRERRNLQDLNWKHYIFIYIST